MSTLKNITSDSFAADVTASDKPVLVDFWAEWCGPCRQLTPILEEIAVENAEKITVVKLNVDENPEAAMEAGITSIPTMKIYTGGRAVKTIIGANAKGPLLEELKAYL